MPDRSLHEEVLDEITSELIADVARGVGDERRKKEVEMEWRKQSIEELYREVFTVGIHPREIFSGRLVVPRNLKVGTIPPVSSVRGKKERPRPKSRRRLVVEQLEPKILLSADPIWELPDDLAPTTELVSTGVNADDLDGGTSVLGIDATITERGRAGLITGFRSDPDRWDFEYDTFGDATLVFLGHGHGAELRSTRTFQPGESFEVKLVYKDAENIVELWIDGALDATASIPGSLTSGAIVHMGGRGPETGGGFESNNIITDAALWTNVTTAELGGILNPVVDEEQPQEDSHEGDDSSASSEESSYRDRASELVATYALHISGSLMENDYSFQEKWLRGEGSPHGRPWFLLLPKGENEAELRAWGGVDNEVSGTTLGVFPRGYYDDVEKFLNAAVLEEEEQEEAPPISNENDAVALEQNEDDAPLLSFSAEDQVNGKLFTGSPDDVVSFGAMPDLEKLPLTVEAWINPAAGNDDRAILSIGENRQGSGGISGIEIGLNAQGLLYVMAATDCNWETVQGPPIEEGKWTHVAVTIGEDQSIAIYRDGLLMREGRWGGEVLFGNAQSADTAIGGVWGHASQDHYVVFAGAMKELTADSGVKSKEEIWASAGESEGRLMVKISEELTLVSTGSEADTAFDYGGKFEKWLYDLNGGRYFVDYDGNVFRSTSDGIDSAEGKKMGEVDVEVYDALPGPKSFELLRYRNVQAPEGSFLSAEEMEVYLDQLKLVERRSALVVFEKFLLGVEEPAKLAEQRFPGIFNNPDSQAVADVMRAAETDVKNHNINIVAGARFVTEDPAWLREHLGDSVALKSNGFRILGNGGLFLDGITIATLEREAVRHGEFLGKIAPHFAEVRAKAIALGVNPNGDGIVHNDLQQFLDDIPDWLREFYEELPAEAQRAFRMAYAGGEYWSGNAEYEDRVVGGDLVALVEGQRYLEAARWLGGEYHRDPLYAVAIAELEGIQDVLVASGTTEVAGEGSWEADVADDWLVASATFGPHTEEETWRNMMQQYGIEIKQEMVSASKSSIAPGESFTISWRFRELFGNDLSRISITHMHLPSGAQGRLRADATLHTKDSYTVPAGITIAPGVHRFSVTATLVNGQRRGGYVEVRVGEDGKSIVDPSTLLNAEGGSLSQAQQEGIRDALNFGNVDLLEAGNKAILEYLIRNYLISDNEDELHYESPEELRGRLHGTGLMQCKEWLQQVVIKYATGMTVANNAEDITTAEWIRDDGKDYTIGTMQAEETFQEMLTREDVKAQAGDVVQVYMFNQQTNKKTPHTMVIGKITSNGAWVFDTNMGNRGEYLTNTEGNEIWQEDNTVRYHFMSWELLNERTTASTIHRISQEKS